MYLEKRLFLNLNDYCFYSLFLGSCLRIYRNSLVGQHINILLVRQYSVWCDIGNLSK